MNKVKDLIVKHIFWIMLVLTFFFLTPILNFYGGGEWNLNRSIGWGGYDPSYVRWLNVVPLHLSIPFFALGYGVLYIFKIKPNTTLSLLHLFLISVECFIPITSLFQLDFIAFAGWEVFVLNFIFSRKKTTLKKEMF